MNQEKNPLNINEPSKLKRTNFLDDLNQKNILGGIRYSAETEPRGVCKHLNSYVDALRQNPPDPEIITRIENTLIQEFGITSEILDSIKQENEEFGQETEPKSEL